MWNKKLLIKRGERRSEEGKRNIEEILRLTKQLDEKLGKLTTNLQIFSGLFHERSMDFPHMHVSCDFPITVLPTKTSPK